MNEAVVVLLAVAVLVGVFYYAKEHGKKKASGTKPPVDPDVGSDPK